MTPAIQRWGIELEAGWRIPLNPSTRCNRCDRNHLSDYTFQDQYDQEHNVTGYCLPESIWTKLINSWEIHGDHSLRFGKGCIAAEIVIRPPARNPETMKEDIKKIWKEVVEVNETTACHIHISFGPFSNGIYSNLATWKFAEQFQQDVGKKFPEVQRRMETRKWAKPYSDKEEFYKHVYQQITSGTWKCPRRDHPLNYAFERYGSIEVRAFPMPFEFDYPPSRIFEYMDFLENYISRFLLAVKKKKIEVIPEFDFASLKEGTW